MNYARSIHRLVILPDYQGLGIGTKFLEAICGVYLKQGYKVHIRTAHEKLGMHMGNSNLWRATGRNKKKGAISNGEINGKNQNMYIVDSVRYSYEYVGEDFYEKPHTELIVDDLADIDMKEMRKLLVSLKQKNYITVVHSKVRERTKLNELCLELGIRTELLYLNNHGVSAISKKHKGHEKLVSLKEGHSPEFRKVA